MRPLAPSLAVVVALLMGACDTSTGPATPRVNSVTVAPRNADVPVGESITLSAAVHVEGGASQDVVWSSSDEGVATVSPTGVVSSHSLGSVVVTATSTFDQGKKDLANLVVFQPDNEPATVAIEAVAQSGTSLLVDPQAVSGLVDVTLSISPGDRVVTRVELLVDGAVVASQVFQPPMGGAAAILLLPAGTPFSAALTFNTGAYQAQTGVAQFLNGDHALVARVATFGGVPGGTANLSLTFANQNTLIALVTASGPTATDGAGRAWTTGDLTVRAIPVVYTPGTVTLISAVIGFPGLQDKTAGPDGVVTWQGSASIAAGGARDFSNNGGLNALAPIIRNSTLSTGPGPSGQFNNGSNIATRLDNRAPHPGVLALTDQSATTACCSGGWVGNNYLFANGHTPLPGDGEGVDGAGIGPGGITYHAGSPVLTNEQIVSLPAVAEGASLSESNLNNAYTVVARVADRVGNVSLIRLTPSASNTTTMFGVDKVAPSFSFIDPGSLTEGAINAGTLIFSTLPLDGRSGFTATPVMHRIFINFDASLCILGGANCAFTQGGSVIAAAAIDGRYFTYQAFARDRAGNASAMITRSVLEDHQLPDILALSLPGSLIGGASTQFSATLADNVDLRSAQHRLDFPQFNGALASIPFVQPVSISDFGSPLVTSQIVFQSIPFVRSIELTAAGGAPSGTLQSTLGTRFSVTDVARNQRSFGQSFPGGAVPPGSSAALAPLSVQTFRMTAPTVTTAVCAVQPCGLVPQAISISAAASGAAGSFNNPFSGGVYFYWIDASGRTQLIGRNMQPQAAEPDGTRTWTWTMSFSAPGAPAQLGVQVFAIGVDADGDGLRTNVNANVVIVGG